MDYLSEEGLSTYDAQIKGYVNAQMAQRSEIPASQMAVINDIDTNVDTMLSNYVTKTDLQNALANIGGGEVITIHTTNASGNAHVEIKSGDTVIDANVGDGDTVTIPFGVEYSIVAYDSNGSPIAGSTAVAAKMSSSFTADLTDISVDLGLPSGNIWAKCNIGASTPYQAGLYFSWGNTTGYASGYDFSSANYNASAGGALTASFTSGNPTYDAAAAIMGGDWRMPTKTEFEELINNCTWTWDSTNKGYTVKGPNNNTIFLYAAGYYSGTTLDSSGTSGIYWSTTYYGSSSAYYLNFNSSSKDVNGDGRVCGLPIRAVRSPQS